jgi:hypothetical protein
MLVAALIVGGLTAFWFGLRPGAYAAGATALACLVAMVMPSLAMWIYVGIGAGVVTVCTIGPRRANPTHAAKATRALRRGLALVKTRLRWK